MENIVQSMKMNFPGRYPFRPDTKKPKFKLGQYFKAEKLRPFLKTRKSFHILERSEIINIQTVIIC